MKYVALLFTVLVVSCSASEEVEVFRFDNDLEIVSRIAGSGGGALGETRYRLFSKYRGEEILFFEGVNPRSYELKRVDGTIHIKFCDGTVHLAQPIFLGPERPELIRVSLDLDCSNSGNPDGDNSGETISN